MSSQLDLSPPPVDPPSVAQDAQAPPSRVTSTTALNYDHQEASVPEAPVPGTSDAPLALTAPQEPLLSVQQAQSGVHSNARPELDVRFIPPTGVPITNPRLSNPFPALETPALTVDDAPAASHADQDEESQEDRPVSPPVSPPPVDPTPATPPSNWELVFNPASILAIRPNIDPYTLACTHHRTTPASAVLSLLSTPALEIPHHGLGPRGANALADVLGRNSTVKVLDLTSCAVEEGGGAIGRALQINRTLLKLDLTGNRLGGEGGADVADMLQFNGTLKILILKDNRLGDHEAQLFSEGLRQNSSLQVLDLSYNSIGDIGAIALGAGVGGNDGLKELNLARNCIRPKGVAGLLNGMKDNGVLTTLNLEASGVGDAGQAVASFLVKNSAIQTLNLRRTRLSDASLVPIARALEQNYSVQTLDISDNPFSNPGALALFKSLLQSNSMTRLIMRNVKLTKEARPKIDELLAEKPDLSIVEISDADEMIAEKEIKNGMGVAAAAAAMAAAALEAAEAQRLAEMPILPAVEVKLQKEPSIVITAEGEGDAGLAAREE